MAHGRVRVHNYSDWHPDSRALPVSFDGLRHDSGGILPLYQCFRWRVAAIQADPSTLIGRRAVSQVILARQRGAIGFMPRPQETIN